MITWHTVSGCIALLLIALLWRDIGQRRRRTLPPGPRPLPILGNVFSIPRRDMGAGFRELSKKHGDIIYLEVLGQPLLVLNALKPTIELLNHKSANFSGRPTSVVMKLLGLDSFFLFMQYGRKWREYRRTYRQSLGEEQVTQYRPIQLASARRLLGKVLKSPTALVEHLNASLAETGMQIIYGMDTSDEDGAKYFRLVSRVASIAELVMFPDPAGILIEAFPVLRHLPAWVPGMGIKRRILEAKEFIHSTLETLHTVSVTSVSDEGVPRDSMVTRILNVKSADAGGPRDVELRERCQYVAATTLIASSETTQAMLEAFVLAMAMHPDKQRTAQEELDSVIGKDRLPDFSDYDHLPYVRAVVKEVLRWHIVSPLGLPHVALEDDAYEGYFIPAGTIVNTNMWAISKDPGQYTDPHGFTPERFLDSDGADAKYILDPSDYVFGSGRRLCPGRHMANAALFIFIASILHAFTITGPEGEDGVPPKMEYKATDTMVSHVLPYDYIAKPRAGWVESLVLKAAQDVAYA
ncbi:hypothetical protein V8D89_000143 [Ganoderma adspersum]